MQMKAFSQNPSQGLIRNNDSIQKTRDSEKGQQKPFLKSFRSSTDKQTSNFSQYKPFGTQSGALPPKGQTDLNDKKNSQRMSLAQ